MRILAIEDNPGDARILRELLPAGSNPSFDIVNAGSLSEASRVLPDTKIDLVLLDLGLPDSRGIETLRRMRSLSSTLPIVVLTGFDDEKTGLEALAGGAQDYLVKGRIDRAALVRSIRYADERHRIEQRLVGKSEHLRHAIRQLNLLNSVTRHDILNKIMVIRSYLPLITADLKDPAFQEYAGKIESAMEAIQSQIEFTRVYQDIGTNEPAWQDVGGLLEASPFPATVKVSIDADGFAVYADPMLPKVFSNLVDNSVRHGEKVTAVRVWCRESDDGLVMTFEDNGVGVPDGEKERIFARGYGKNTGLGLFLAREILAITGMTIRETGVPGEGARFEITVPEEMYRISPAP